MLSLPPTVRVFVVVEHSRSNVPFWISGMRFCAVNGMTLTCKLGAFSSVLMRSTTFIMMS